MTVLTILSKAAEKISNSKRWLWISILGKLMAEQATLDVTMRQLDLCIDTATVTILVLQFSSPSH